MKGLRIHEYLKINGEQMVECIKCGREICGAGENYKDHAAKREVDPTEIPLRTRDKSIEIYYEYYCPGCATLLEVDAAAPGERTLKDIAINL